MIRRVLPASLLVWLLGACGPAVGTRPAEETPADAGVMKPDAGAVVKCRPACGSTQTCVDGHCEAKPCDSEEETLCGAICVDLSSNSSHCGECGTHCGGGWPLCSDGACGQTCGSSFCPITSRCQLGHCCPGGTEWCTDRCVGTEDDVNNCGGCGTVCSANDHGTATCESGMCVLSCTMPYVTCGSACVNYDNDARNCGECGHICPSGTTCGAGHCAKAVATCTIQASSSWQSCSGLRVNASDSFAMTATGMWSPSDSRGPNGPTGSLAPRDPFLDYPYDETLPIGALLWSIEDTSAVYAFTSGTNIGGSTENGQVQFRMNTLLLHDPSGSLEVTVAVYP